MDLQKLLKKAQGHFYAGLSYLDMVSAYLKGQDDITECFETSEFLKQMDSGTFLHPEAKEIKKAADKLPSAVSKLNSKETEKHYIQTENKEEDIMQYKGHKIERRSDNRYQARFMINGERICVYGKTQQKCLEKLKAALNGFKPKGENGNIKFSTYLNKWLSLYREGVVSSATYKKDKNNANNLIAEFGEKKLRDITTEDIQLYLKKVNGDRQREHYKTLLNTAFNRAIKVNYIKINPVDNVIIKKYYPEEKDALTLKKEQDFTEAIQNSEYQIYFKIILFEGLRPEELAALKAENIHDGYIKVKKAIDVNNEMSRTKSRAGVRQIPIFEVSKPLFIEYKPLAISIDTLRRHFNDIRDKLGWSDEITLYTLRHTFITRCAERGVHPKILQKWAGHSTIEMTLKYYTHISTEWEAEIIEMVNKKRRKNDTKSDTQIDTNSED